LVLFSFAEFAKLTADIHRESGGAGEGAARNKTGRAPTDEEKKRKHASTYAQFQKGNVSPNTNLKTTKTQWLTKKRRRSNNNTAIAMEVLSLSSVDAAC